MLGTATEAPRERRHHGQQRKKIKTQLRTDQPKISKESTVDANSGEQEHWSKPRAACSGQESSKGEGKRSEDEGRPAKQSRRPHDLGP